MREEEVKAGLEEFLRTELTTKFPYDDTIKLIRNTSKAEQITIDFKIVIPPETVTKLRGMLVDIGPGVISDKRSKN